jgi:cysteine sulfinate desulfinase/cysteine desulfurase-like protein
MRRLYFDHNASTPLAPEVAAVMRRAQRHAHYARRLRP